jgi:hypothetical protein
MRLPAQKQRQQLGRVSALGDREERATDEQPEEKEQEATEDHLRKGKPAKTDSLSYTMTEVSLPDTKANANNIVET